MRGVALQTGSLRSVVTDFHLRGNLQSVRSWEDAGQRRKRELRPLFAGQGFQYSGEYKLFFMHCGTEEQRCEYRLPLRKAVPAWEAW